MEINNQSPKGLQSDVSLEKAFIEKVQKGLKQAKKGKTVKHDKAIENFRKKWSK